jgi:hypothetical protein
LLQACLHPRDWLAGDLTEDEQEWARRSNTC